MILQSNSNSIPSLPTASEARSTNWFNQKNIKGGVIHDSYATQTADFFAATATNTGVAAVADVLGSLARGSFLGTVAVVGVGAVAGALTGAIAMPAASYGLQKAFGAEIWDDGGNTFGGIVLGGLAGGLGAAAGAFGAGPAAVALTVAGTTAAIGGGIAILDNKT